MTVHDYSNNYTLSKRGRIYIAAQKEVVHFKPFLQELSYSKEQKINTIKNFYDEIQMSDGAKEGRKISFNVLSVSEEEAKTNHIKFQKLLRMILPQKNNNRNIMYVKFSNLITNPDEPNSQQTYSYTEVVSKGLKCHAGGLDYKPDMDLGFFDSYGMFFAKSFLITLDLKAVQIPIRKIEKQDFSGATKLQKPGSSFGFPVPFKAEKK